jgi:hypothetical protein
VIKVYSEFSAQGSPWAPDPKGTFESQKESEKHFEFPTSEFPSVFDPQEPVPDQIVEERSDNNIEFKEFKANLKKMDLRLQSIEIQQGKIILIDSSSKSSSGPEIPINVSFRLETERPSPERMDAVIDSLELGIEDFLFHGTIHIEDLLGSKSKVKADLRSDPTSFSRIRRVANLFPNFKVPQEMEKGNIEHISIHLDVPLATMDNLNALKQKARLDFALKIKDAVYRKNDWNILLPRLTGEGTWENNLLTHKIHGEIFGGKFEEKGSVRFSKTPQSENTLTIDSDVNFTGLDFSKATFPGNGVWRSLQGKAGGSIKIKGPVTLSEKGAEFDRLHWNGIFNGENLVMENQDSLQQAARATFLVKQASLASTVPVEFELEGIKVHDIPVKKVKGIIHIKPNTLQLVDAKIWPQNGEIQLAGNYNLQEKIYALDIQGKHLRAEDLSQNAMNGPVSFSGKFKGRMTPEKSSKKTEFDHFTHGLSGTFHVNTSNGTIKELGDIETLLTVLNLTTLISKKDVGLGYEFIGGDFKIRKGLLVTDNFIIDGPQLKMLVVGKAKLPDGKVDAEITAMPLQMLDSLVKAVPLLGEILTGSKKGGLLVTHCKVTGTLENPQFKLQLHKSATEKPTDIFKGITNLPKRLMDSE